MHERIERFNIRSLDVLMFCVGKTFVGRFAECRKYDRGRVAMVLMVSKTAKVALGLLLHQIRVFFSLAVVDDTQSDSTFGELLAVRLFAQNLESKEGNCQRWDIVNTLVNTPLLVILALGVRLEVVLALKPFRAFCAVVLAQTGQVLYILGLHVLLQVTGSLEIRNDLVIVSVWRLAIKQPNEDRLYNAEGKLTWCDACS